MSVISQEHGGSPLFEEDTANKDTSTPKPSVKDETDTDAMAGAGRRVRRRGNDGTSVPPEHAFAEEDDGFEIIRETVRRVRLPSIDKVVERAKAFDILRGEYKNFVVTTAKAICKGTDEELRMDLEDYATSIMAVPKGRFVHRASQGGKWYERLEDARKVLRKENAEVDRMNNKFWRDSEDAKFRPLLEERRTRLEDFETGVKQAYRVVEEAKKFQG
ncbi:hypothetical protein LTR17_008169 [Elasticomyces elasticus]|nr:hypothetical protein LTR17_008169 [Elasticomyces elasticus]